MASGVDDLLAPVEERFRTLERVTRAAAATHWERRCAGEGWPVALVCYHIARGFDRQASFIDAAVSDAGPDRYSWDETHVLNAQIAVEHPSPDPEMVIATARGAIERVRTVLTTTSDADLAFPAFVNGTFTAGWTVANSAV